MSAKEVNEDLKAKADLVSLAEKVIEWWEEHQQDFFEKPVFVRLAEQALEKHKK